MNGNLSYRNKLIFFFCLKTGTYIKYPPVPRSVQFMLMDVLCLQDFYLYSYYYIISTLGLQELNQDISKHIVLYVIFSPLTVDSVDFLN